MFFENKTHGAGHCPTSCGRILQHSSCPARRKRVYCPYRCGESRCVGGHFTCAGAKGLQLLCTAVFYFLIISERIRCHISNRNLAQIYGCIYIDHCHIAGIRQPRYTRMHSNRMGTLWHQQTPSTGRGTNVNALQWALDNGVTAGTTESTFSPDNTCTRAQIVTFLYRAMV